MKTSDKLFWAYLAGFIDGEGSIGIAFDKRGNTPRTRYFIRLSIGQRVKAPLLYIQRQAGIGFIQQRLRIRPRVRRGQYRPTETESFVLWITRRADVAKVLTQILPHLIVKGRQVELAVGLINRKTWTEAHCRQVKQELEADKRKGMIA